MDTPGRALVVFAHPDDAEFGCSGTIAKWVQEGAEVHYLVCTNGDKGSTEPEMLPERLAPVREAEQRAAAAVLGVKSVECLGYPDGELEPTRAFLGQVVRAIRRVKPDAIITSEPHPRTYHSHRDHRMAGLVTLDACFPYARDHLHFPEHMRQGLEPHKVGAILFFGGEEPLEFVDITGTMDTKIRALYKHASQVRGRDIEELVRKRSHEIGERAGYEYAEAFRKIEFRR
ncbi:MAG: PIG-L family deacetylase [Dehalococcoidia bacterium]|nr:PIG-L family deacetylase [Dehalococcoidia bacterium]